MSEFTTRDDATTDYITAACIRRQVCALDDEFHNVPSRRIGMPNGYHDIAMNFAALERSLAIYMDGIQARERIK